MALMGWNYLESGNDRPLVQTKTRHPQWLRQAKRLAPKFKRNRAADAEEWRVVPRCEGIFKDERGITWRMMIGNKQT